MRKILVLACISAFILTACGQAEAEKPAETTAAAEVTTEAATEAATTEAVTEEETEAETEETEAAEKTAGTEDELTQLVEKDVEDTILVLNSEYEELKSDVDSYDKYLENADEVKAFYTHVVDTHKELCIRMREYSISYAEMIFESDKSNDDKYDDLEGIYDIIYDDAGDDIYDGIYDGLLDDMYDDFYDGIIDDGYDNAPYDEWYDARSDEYDWWSDARSDLYDDWSDFRSDLYDFWSDLRSEMWDDDVEKAMEKADDFQADIDKLRGDSIQKSDESADDNNASDSESKSTELVDGMHPEFKEAMDSYEAVMNEYCEFMIKYNESPDDLDLLDEYLDYVEKYDDAAEDFYDWYSEDLTDEEYDYLLEVETRVLEKLADCT